MWVLALLAFSLPGRDVAGTLGSVDFIAFGKILARFIAILAGAAVLWKYRTSPRLRTLADVTLPWGLLFCWAVFSVLWSPMKAVSLGQSGSLAAQLLIAMVIGLLATDRQRILTVIFQINLMLASISLILVCVHMAAPGFSGLERGLLEGSGSTGLVHPTSAGATASLGIVLLTLTRLTWNVRWSRWLLLPGIGVHVALMFLATSRMAFLMTAIVLGLAMLVLLNRVWFAGLTLVLTVLVTLYLSVDPGLTVLESTFGTAAGYLTRNESTESLSSLTGRTELWAAVWSEFTKSPIRGCGYFVTSQDGMLDVWSGPANRTAHNVLLQVLSTTGVVGLLIFGWGGLRLLRRVVPDLARCAEARKVGIFLLLVGCWYAGWGQLCSSFMGPIQPESLVFFACLGIALAVLRSSDDDLRCTDAAILSQPRRRAR
jgi:O-antigen ligase